MLRLRKPNRLTAWCVVSLVFAFSLFSPFGFGLTQSEDATKLVVEENKAYAQNAPPSSVEVTIKGNVDDFGECGFLDFPCYSGWIFHMVIYTPTHWLAILSANLLDFFMDYSISRAAYTQSNFMVEGWRVVRDLVNIGFIFVLLYIAFLFILDVNKYDAKKFLVRVIIIAVVVNFSLFISRVLIDSSNALSHVFYDTIDTTEQVSDGIRVTESKPVAIQVVDKVRPQKILIGEQDVFTNLLNTLGGLGTYFLVYLAASAMNVFISWVFFSVMLLFVGRVVGLWLYTIFSPLAFLTYAVPGFENVEFVGWRHWWQNMISLSFMAPIFIFLLYLTVQFLSITYSAPAGTPLDLLSDDPIKFLLLVTSVMIPLVVVFILLKTSKTIAEKMSGDFAGVAVKWGQKIGSTITGGAAASIALGLRSTRGRGAYNTLQDEELKKRAREGDKKAQRKLDKAEKRAGRTYDLRNIKPIKNIIKKSGYDVLTKPIKTEKKYQEGLAKQEWGREKRYGVDQEFEDEKLASEIQALEKQAKEMDELETELQKLSKTIEDAEINARQTPDNEARAKYNLVAERARAKKTQKTQRQEQLLGGESIQTWRSEMAAKINSKNAELSTVKAGRDIPLRESYASQYPGTGFSGLIKKAFVSQATRDKHAKTIRDKEKAKKAGGGKKDKLLDDLVKEINKESKKNNDDSGEENEPANTE